ncbi:hypothetical protein BDQ17DRAFT_1413989 [Cyathus striatus]|nr:hypothetical protein BDQ17DRAFT_1413989 [Cyathus striatus]
MNSAINCSKFKWMFLEECHTSHVLAQQILKSVTILMILMDVLQASMYILLYYPPTHMDIGTELTIQVTTKTTIFNPYITAPIVITLQGHSAIYYYFQHVLTC